MSVALKKNKLINQGPIKVDLLAPKQPHFIGSYMLSDDAVCEKLIEKINNSKDTTPGVIHRYEKTMPIVDVETKDSTDLVLDLSCPIIIEYGNFLQDCLNMYKKEYYYSDQTSPYRIEGGNIQKYNKGGAFHKWHTEKIGLSNIQRHLVFMTYLNDVEDGGETEFFYQKLKVKPRKGLTLIWPADWTHMHRGVPSPTEVKYIATGWYSFVGDNIVEGDTEQNISTFERAI